MAVAQYHSITTGKSWELPLSWMQPHLKFTCGVWFRRTLEKRVLSLGNANNHEIYDSTPISCKPRDDGIREIRVFSLNPGKADDPITGSLSTTTLNQPCAYKALSYCWGDRPTSCPIQVGEGTLNVTENLFDALSHTRSMTETKILWTDAICINQSDNNEKSNQVQVMNDIYFAASRVIVWLGRSTDHTEVGMRVLDSFIKAEHQQEPPRQSLPPSLIAKGLKDILHRGWFERFWVVQEAALAKEVVMVCAPYQVSWKNQIRPVLNFMRAIKLAVISPEWQTKELNGIDMGVLLGLLQAQLENGQDAKLWANRSRTPDLLELAYSMRHRQASDPRDRTFALIGMINFEDRILPDYSKSNSQVWSDFAQRVSRQTEIMCNDLENTMMLPAALRSEPTQKEMTPVQFLRNGNDTQAHSDFVDQTHARVHKNILENDFDGAARLMEGAAMLLRGHKFHAQPTTQDTL